MLELFWMCAYYVYMNYSESDAVHIIRSLNLRSSYGDRCIQNTVKYLG